MVRGVQRLSGVRQSHVQPALSDGLQTTMLAGDIREDPRTGLPPSYAALFEVVPDGVNVKRCVFVNPLTSDKIAVFRRLHIYTAEDMAGAARSVIYNLIPQVGIVWNIIKGYRLVDGYRSTVGGLAPPNVNPPSGLDVDFPPRPSQMGFHSPALNGIDGGYFWRGVIDGIGEIEENFEKNNGGPRIIIFPGGTFQTYAIDNAYHAYVNLWWDEYSVT